MSWFFQIANINNYFCGFLLQILVLAWGIVQKCVYLKLQLQLDPREHYLMTLTPLFEPAYRFTCIQLWYVRVTRLQSIRGHICQGGWHIPCEVAACLKCTMKRCCYVCGRRLPTLVQLWNLEPRFCRLLVSKPSVHLGAQTTELKHLYSRNYILAYS